MKRAHESALPDSYDHYVMSLSETLTSFFLAGTVLFAVGVVFYGHLVYSLGLACLGWLYVPVRRQQLRRNRLARLRLQFKEMLLSLSSALTAGKSIENALKETAADLRRLEGGLKTMMIRELDWINIRIQNGVSVQESVRSFSERSGDEDIRSFAEVFAVCSRSGGNMVEVVRRTSQWISEKVDIEQEMTVLVAQKRWEANVLSFMPFLLVTVMRVSSPEYMEPLYTGSGRIIMTAGLAVLLGAVWIIRRLVDIRV